MRLKSVIDQPYILVLNSHNVSIKLNNCNKQNVIQKLLKLYLFPTKTAQNLFLIFKLSVGNKFSRPKLF